jgi:hypothetical protein
MPLLEGMVKKDIPMLLHLTKDNYISLIKGQGSFQRAKNLLLIERQVSNTT